MKKRTLTLTLCLLALVALFSVGFAAWVVTAPINDTEVEGNFVVEEVSDERVTLSAVIEAGQGNIVFGKEKVDSAEWPYAYKWLLLDGVAEEKLQVVVTLTITGYEYLEYITLNLTQSYNSEVQKPHAYDDTDYAGTDYSDAVAAGLVSALGYQNVTYTKSQLELLTDANEDVYCVDNGDGTATVTIKVNFQWGSLFEGQNPAKYFNNQNNLNADGKANKELGDLAVKSLKDLEGYLTGVSYKLTIQGKDNK